MKKLLPAIGLLFCSFSSFNPKRVMFRQQKISLPVNGSIVPASECLFTGALLVFWVMEEWVMNNRNIHVTDFTRAAAYF